jgi:hypothetical protein
MSTKNSRLIKIGALLGFVLLLALGILIKLKFESGFTQKHEAEKIVEAAPTPEEEAKTDAVVDENIFNVSMAADATFRAFDEKVDSVCYDSKTRFYFFHFIVGADSFEGSDWHFKEGWNVVENYKFIILQNHTAALQVANPMPIAIDTTGLNCVDKK